LNTKQLAVIIIACTTIGSIYFFGNTNYPKKAIQEQQQGAITVDALIAQAETSLEASQKSHYQHIKEELQNAKTKEAKINAFEEAFLFWGRDVKNDELATFYFAEKAKLENSEKKLTFAANFILESCLRDKGDFLKKGFRANIAKELFEQSITLNPQQDSLKIGLGTSYMLGAKTNNPMQGTTILLEIVKKDSTNAYAHKMLAYGGLMTGQNENAMNRFIKTFTYNPTDVEAAVNVAILSKQLNKVELSKQWKQKVAVLLSSQPKLLEEFEKEYQSSK
jgi:Tfp pilus assembly protein PilF